MISWFNRKVSSALFTLYCFVPLLKRTIVLLQFYCRFSLYRLLMALLLPYKWTVALLPPLHVPSDQRHLRILLNRRNSIQLVQAALSFTGQGLVKGSTSERVALTSNVGRGVRSLSSCGLLGKTQRVLTATRQYKSLDAVLSEVVPRSFQPSTNVAHASSAIVPSFGTLGSTNATK